MGRRAPSADAVAIGLGRAPSGPLAGVCVRTNRVHGRRGLLAAQLAGPMRA